MNILWGNFYSQSLFFLIYITASSLNVDDGTANQVSNKCQTIKSSLDALGVSLSAVAMKWDTNCSTSQPAGAAGEDWAKVEKQQQLNEWHGNV